MTDANSKDQCLSTSNDQWVSATRGAVQAKATSPGIMQVAVVPLHGLWASAHATRRRTLFVAVVFTATFQTPRLCFKRWSLGHIGQLLLLTAELLENGHAHTPTVHILATNIALQQTLSYLRLSDQSCSRGPPPTTGMASHGQVPSFWAAPTTSLRNSRK